MTKPSERAELFVNGQVFFDWKSVHIEIAVDEVYSRCSFEATEFHEVPSSWTALQFKPGDRCVVKLGGVKVMDGYVIERHAAYAARIHQVQINAVSLTFDLVNTSTVSQTGNYDGKTAKQVIEELARPYGIKVRTVGKISDEVFTNLHIEQGETPYRKMAQVAAHREIVIGTDPDGGIVLTSGHSEAHVDSLVEGGNILRANAVIRDENAYSLNIGTGQTTGSDASHGDHVSKMRVEIPGTSGRYRPIIHPMILPDSMKGLRMLTRFERARRDGSKIEAHITVQGWFRENGEIWRHNQFYWVDSPMLMLDMVLKSRKVTWMQSNAGTFTTLEMVLPEYAGGQLDIRT